MALLKPVEIVPKPRYDVSDIVQLETANGKLRPSCAPSVLILEIDVTAWERFASMVGIKAPPSEQVGIRVKIGRLPGDYSIFSY